MVRSIAPSTERKCAMSLRPKALVRQNQRQLMVNQSDHGGCEDVQYLQKKLEATTKFKQLAILVFV